MKMRVGAAAIVAVAAILAIGAGIENAPAPPKSKKTLVAGVAWETSVEAAKQQAKKEGKAILLMQLFGKLDEEFC